MCCNLSFTSMEGNLPIQCPDRNWSPSNWSKALYVCWLKAEQPVGQYYRSLALINVEKSYPRTSLSWYLDFIQTDCSDRKSPQLLLNSFFWDPWNSGQDDPGLWVHGLDRSCDIFSLHLIQGYKRYAPSLTHLNMTNIFFQAPSWNNAEELFIYASWHCCWMETSGGMTSDASPAIHYEVHCFWRKILWSFDIKKIMSWIQIRQNAVIVNASTQLTLVRDQSVAESHESFSTACSQRPIQKIEAKRLNPINWILWLTLENNYSWLWNFEQNDNVALQTLISESWRWWKEVCQSDYAVLQTCANTQEDTFSLWQPKQCIPLRQPQPRGQTLMGLSQIVPSSGQITWRLNHL